MGKSTIQVTSFTISKVYFNNDKIREIKRQEIITRVSIRIWY